MKGRLQLPMYTAAALAAANPLLLKGEVVYESDTNRRKIGDGATAWNALSYDEESTEAVKMTTTNSTAERIMMSPGCQVVASSRYLDVELSAEEVTSQYSADAILMVPQDSFIRFEAGRNINRIFYGWENPAEELVADALTCYTIHFVPSGSSYDVFLNMCTYKPY